MKKLLAISVIGSSLLIGSNPAKADWDQWGFINKQETINGHIDSYIHLYTINSSSGEATFRRRWCGDNNCRNNSGLSILKSTSDILYPEKHVDKDTIILREYETNSSSTILHKKYNLSGDTFTGETISDSSSEKWYADYTSVAIRGQAQIDSDGNYYSDLGGQMWIKQTSDGTVSFGKSGSSTPIYSLSETGVSQNGTNLISRSSDGITSIGANSVKLQEISDIQRIWATNSSGTKIPINIYGSDFQINGVSVQDQIDTNKSGISTNTSNISTNTSNISTNTSNISTNTSNISTNTSNIKNLGEGVAGSTALTAALTALPQTSKESKLSCGVGTGAYSSRYAVGFGCASKINERVDVNAGGSYVFGGAKSYGKGTLDNGVIKAGFVFKLGELNKPTQISMKDKKVMETKIESLEKKNKTILSKNQKLENKLSTLMARLEKIEKIALGESKSKDLAVYPLK